MHFPCSVWGHLKARISCAFQKLYNTLNVHCPPTTGVLLFVGYHSKIPQSFSRCTLWGMIAMAQNGNVLQGVLLNTSSYPQNSESYKDWSNLFRFQLGKNLKQNIRTTQHSVPAIRTHIIDFRVVSIHSAYGRLFILMIVYTITAWATLNLEPPSSNTF